MDFFRFLRLQLGRLKKDGSVGWHDIAGWHGMVRSCRIRITFRIRDSAIVD